MKRLEALEQGSKEWHEFRAAHRMASETPAVMGCSPWFPKTMIQLARVKRGLDVIPDNPAMKHGRDNEAKAREWLEQTRGEAFQPCVVLDDDEIYAASLDGISFDGETIAEIKAPPKGRGSLLYEEVAAGKIPQNYLLQMQHQLMVSGAKRCLLAVWDGTECLCVFVDADPSVWGQIRAGWEEFWPLMYQEEEPVEYITREDEAWTTAAQRLKDATAERDKFDVLVNEAKMDLEIMADKKNTNGGGVAVTLRSRKGNVNYKAVPELKGVDLEPYRGKPNSFWEVRVLKEKKS